MNGVRDEHLIAEARLLAPMLPVFLHNVFAKNRPLLVVVISI